MDETERILDEYARRRTRAGGDEYAYSIPSNLFLRQSQERALAWALHQGALLPLESKRLLDIGYGEGRWSELWLEMGAMPHDISGIELDPVRAEVAKLRHPACDYRVGDASELPFDSSSFDVVTQATVFTSVLDPSMRAAIVGEIDRVLRPGGIFVWYDFAFDNPRNRAVRGVSPRTLARLFPGWRIDARRVTLAPPITRRLARWWPLAGVLEELRVLNTHLIAVLQRK